MARETLEIGSTPYDEDCAQVGSDDYAKRGKAECNRFIALLTKKFGNPPGEAYFYVKSNPHDFGTYYEVAIKFNPNDEAECDFAYRVEGNTPATWDDDAKYEEAPKNILRDRITDK
jgi:hypothetical protein